MTTEAGTSDDRRRRTLAAALFATALAEAVVAVGAGTASGLGWPRLSDALVGSNAAIGLALAVAGRLIAHHRPRNPVGWSLLVGGVCWAFTGTGTAVLAWAVSHGWAGVPWRLLATLTNGGWTWALALFVPLALALLPDGRLPSRRWRWLPALLVGNGVVFTALAVIDPLGGMPALVGARGYPDMALPGLEWAGAAVQLPIAAGYLGAVVALVLRYRRGGDTVRRQLLWLVLAMIVMLAAFALEATLRTETLLLGILPILLVPLAITIAVLRHQLLDIRLVVSRSVLYLLLTGGVVGGYLALVATLDVVVRRQSVPVLATLAVALAVNPVRVWLQGLVHRAFYGARRDPVQAIATVGARLSQAGTAADGVAGVLETLCRVMRFPAAAIMVDDHKLTGHGELPPGRHAVALRSGDTAVGELVVGLRAGEGRLDPADELVLTLLAAPLAVAVRAGRLADELAVSRERVISGREEERRRIRRDLHDGLGPVLTSVVLNADAARRLLGTDPARSTTLLGTVCDQTVGAIEEIRRLVYDLRPPALDGMGLVGALHEYASVLSRGGDSSPVSVRVDGPTELPELPAAVEVAVYRIATEALTNVVRHSTASTAVVRLGVEATALCLEICDNGVNAADSWQPGVGLASIRERTAELGGECEIRHDRTGGRIRVRLPLPAPGRQTDSTVRGSERV
ncbi:sensor histidine kinase [Actinoplanes sp. NPDC004185]